VLPDRHKLPVVPLDEQHSPHQEQQAQHQVHPALLGAAAAVSATRVGWATCGGRAIRRALRPGVLSGRADSPQLRGPVGEIGHGQSRVSDVTRLVARIHGHGQDCRSRRGCGVGWWGERGFVGPGGGGDECMAVGHPPQEANRDAAGRWVVGARHGRQAQVAWHGVGVAGSKARCEGCAAAQVAPEPRAGACNHCRGGGGGGALTDGTAENHHRQQDLHAQTVGFLEALRAGGRASCGAANTVDPTAWLLPPASPRPRPPRWGLHSSCSACAGAPRGRLPPPRLLLRSQGRVPAACGRAVQCPLAAAGGGRPTHQRIQAGAAQHERIARGKARLHPAAAGGTDERGGGRRGGWGGAAAKQGRTGSAGSALTQQCAHRRHASRAGTGGPRPWELRIAPGCWVRAAGTHNRAFHPLIGSLGGLMTTTGKNCGVAAWGSRQLSAAWGRGRRRACRQRPWAPVPGSSSPCAVDTGA
jgi:hypothetical protein